MLLLVVMAAVLAVGGARQRCNSSCHLTKIAIQVESCGRMESIITTVCAGQCFTTDQNYIGHDDMTAQVVCNGNWTYEVKEIPGCPVSITYPVATNCRCTACNSGDTHCGRYIGDSPSCLPF
ncbi:gonadotropin subunit beta-1-like [Halichoeres trimaculatus]|uniref:gonadotropin subunit beta-1-like n=1 Tax=Halichoeres trimaculatus TaxID=147232 RepID=UPI003D9F81D3